MPARPTWLGRLALLTGALLLASACATPVGVNRVDHATVYRSLAGSVLSSTVPSLYSQQLLTRQGLGKRFEEEPAAVLAQLHGRGAGLEPDLLFVLAELSFVHAERAHDRQYYLAAAVYAFAFITHPDWRAAGFVANAIDPRTRMACDLFNLGLVNGLRVDAPPTEDGTEPPPEVRLDDRVLPLPFGTLTIERVRETFLWGGYLFNRFISTAEYEIRGLANRYRQAGLGAPLLAELEPVSTGPEGLLSRKRIPPTGKVAVTALVRIEGVHEGLATGRLRGILSVHPADAGRTIEIAGGEQMPVELDPSAALAYMLEGAPVWDTELAGFFKGGRPVFGDGLITLHPYTPGRVPVVLVHGTASSPARWAEIVNEIQNDPVLADRVQIWLFNYNTSSPILYSASLLRQALESALRDFDPAGWDPAMRHMVIIGHSQGGLLARLMVTSSGTRFWDAAANIPFADLRATPEQRALLQRVAFFEPLPFVDRVVFLATPHRGSFRVTGPVLNLVRRLITLPVRLVQPIEELAKLNPGAVVASMVKALPTAMDNMSPTHQFVRTLSQTSIAPGVTTHSIIAVQGEGGPEGLSDGIVRYESAHLDGVASEKVVRSGHSLQAQPETVLEVRRILREHIGAR